MSLYGLKKVFRGLFKGHLFALLIGLIPAYQADAQEGGGEAGSEISMFVGSLLPNQIDGVTEILPVFGGRFGMPTQRLGVVEIGFSNTHAEGVDFTIFSTSLRADLPAIDQFIGSVYGGFDLSWFRPAGSEDRKTETGLHVGTALSMMVNNNLWVRSDLKFNASPGTSMALQFGLVFRGP
jgi:hypothetical protein